MKSGFFRNLPRLKFRRAIKVQGEEQLEEGVDDVGQIRGNAADDWINGQESGIYSLPPEVLHIIFWMCLEDESYPIGEDHPLLTLSAVCSLWRTVIISDTGLWASFRLCIAPFVTPQKLSGIKNILELFLERAQNKPLRMELRHKGPQGVPEMPSRISVMRVLSLKYFHLFTELDFIAQTEDAYCRLAKLGAGTSTFTKLETLSLRVKPGLLDLHPDLKLFRSAPNLRHVCLHSESMLTTFKFGLPFHQITRLDFRIKETFGDYAIMAWHYLLAECSNLEEASVRFLCHPEHSECMGSTPPLGGNSKVHEFSTIKNLEISNDFAGDASAIFGDTTRFPTLERLEIRAKTRCKITANKRDSDDAGSRTSNSHLYLDILKSAVALGSLETLRLVKVSIHAEALFNLLHLTPRLTEFELLSVRDKRASGSKDGRPYLTSTDQDILRVLTVSDQQLETGDYVCPELRFLALRDPIDSEDGGEVGAQYAELAQSRSRILNRKGIGPSFCLTLYFAKGGDGRVRRSMIV